MKLLRTFFVVIGLAVWSLAAIPADAAPAPESFADLAEEHAPAVVNVYTTQFIERSSSAGRPDIPPGFRDFFDDFLDDEEGEEGETTRQRALSLGSGFIISPDGYIVTNNHVVDKADEISVRLTNGDEYDAVVVGRDPLSDIALLKIEAEDALPHVSFGDSDAIRVGEWVMTIGNPFGLGGTVTAGIVSARNRDIGNGNYDDFIQTDASINRGNSGGPMFNMEGQVIGVNTMIFSPTGTNIGIGFAIPSNQVSHVVDQLREFGRTRRGWIGVTIQAVTEEVAESLGLESASGAIISLVVDGGPSDEAGLEPGDIIIEFNGVAVGTSRDLPFIVAETSIDESVEIVVLRGGEEITFTLVTGELETEGPGAQAEPEEEPEEQPQQPEQRILGMVLKPLDSAGREQYDLPEDMEGILIENLSRNSEAALRGIRPGDVILQVNLKNVTTVREIEEAIADARDQDRGTVLLRLYREGNYFHIPLPVDEGGE
ncbi:MAG: DegQ family serine endoprotease [Proteobacteria bacterium]|nr:DegQ family serine endoprotease [Pseudomonadota bacterium]